MRPTVYELEPDGLLPVTNLPYGSITDQAECLTTQHPGELTVAEFHALPARYYEKIARSRTAACGWCGGDVETCRCYSDEAEADDAYASTPHPSAHIDRQG